MLGEREGMGPIPAVWASSLNVIAGLWLILAPFILGYSDFAPAFWNDVIVGVLILASAFAATRTYSPNPSWMNVVLGVWLILAPFMLNYDGYRAALANDLCVGLLVGILALLAALAKAPLTRGRATGM